MKWARIFVPSIEVIFLIAVFWGIAASGPKMLNLDGDLPRHLLVGRLSLETGNISTVDIFSYRTVGFPAFPHEWLVQVILSISNTIFGLDGVILFIALLITLTFAIVYRIARERASSLLSLIFTGLALSAGTIHFLPRPHIFTYLFMAIWLFQMEKVRTRESRAWYLFPILMLLWVNMHGMFIIGLVIWGAYFVGGILDASFYKWRHQTESRLLLIGGLASVPTTILSPSGAGIWKTIFELGSNTYLTSRIPEYQSANFQHPGTWPFIILLVLLVSGLALNTRRISWSHILLLSGFLMLALYSSRMIPLFAIVSAPIGAQVLSNWVQEEKPNSKFVKLEVFLQQMEASTGGIVWLAISFFIIAFLFASGRPINPQQQRNSFDTGVFPIAAVDWLQSHPQSGLMLNDFNWGGYILLETWPEYQIFMDGHTHIYGEALTREYEQVINVYPGWESIIEKYQASWAIIPTHSRLAASLMEVGWVTLYRDNTAIILRNKVE
jgi:hypothetical protein